MSKENCCELGKTGNDCEKECSYYNDTFCNHPSAESEYPDERPTCGHMCC